MHHTGGYDILGGYGESTRDSWSYGKGASTRRSSNKGSAKSSLLSFAEFGDFNKFDKKKGYESLEITRPSFAW